MKKMIKNAWIFVMIAGVATFTACDDQDMLSESEFQASQQVTGMYDDSGMMMCEIDHRTQTPGGWGSGASGNNPGAYRDLNFDLAFPEGIHIGCFGSEGHCLYLTSAKAVENFLPAGGKPAVFTIRDVIDPTAKEMKNSLASHMVALALSLGFDAYDPDFSASGTALGDLVVACGPFQRYTVYEVFSIANDVIGGCRDDYAANDIYDVVYRINENFVDGIMNNGFLVCKGTAVNCD